MARNIVADNPAIARLVERQMRNQELAREQRFEVEKVSQSPVEEFVCISRQVGTDGPGLAQDLGRRLGWPVFDREILDEMAGDDAVRRQVYESMDQRDLSWWEESLRALMQSEFVRNDYFQKLSETLLSLARQGDCVFRGRGADLLLPASGGSSTIPGVAILPARTYSKHSHRSNRARMHCSSPRAWLPRMA